MFSGQRFAILAMFISFFEEAARAAVPGREEGLGLLPGARVCVDCVVCSGEYLVCSMPCVEYSVECALCSVQFEV